MTKKTLGFYLSGLTAILALVCVYLYGSISIKHNLVRPLLITSMVLTIVVLAATAKMGKLPGGDLLPVVNSVLLIAAAGLATMPMVTQIVQAFVGMNPMSTIQGYLTFVVLELVVWAMNIVAAFLGITKKTI